MEGLQDIFQLIIIVTEGKLIKLLVMGVDFEEWVETPHEVVTDGPEKSSLPVNQEGLNSLAFEILQFLVLIITEVNIYLPEHEVVRLCVSMAQSVEVFNSRIIENLNNKKFAFHCERVQFNSVNLREIKRESNPVCPI